MRTQLAFDAAGPGLPLGLRNESVDPDTAAVTWHQGAIGGQRI
jgi:hypothetical protein